MHAFTSSVSTLLPDTLMPSAFAAGLEPDGGHKACALSLVAGSQHIPSDTKLLLTKDYSERLIFEKLPISYVVP